MSFKERFWPDVDDLRKASSAARQGVYACAGLIIVAVVFFALGSLTGMDWLLDTVMFAVIGTGIYRFRRTAAVAGLLLYWVERVILISEQEERLSAASPFTSLFCFHSR